MSSLTVILRVLAVLTTIVGCNVYRFMPHSCTFRRRPKLQSLITLLHSFWLRPWIFIASYLHARFFILRFLLTISADVEDSDKALTLVYYLSALTFKYQNIITSISITYIYKYHLKNIERTLNEFANIYQRFIRRFGHAPRINWWLFFVYFTEWFTLAVPVTRSSGFTRIPYVGEDSPMDKFLSWSAVLFVSLQPLFLSLAAHLGFLLLHGYYEKEQQLLLQYKQLRTDDLLENYVSLMQLRQHFELLLRPFVCVGLFSELISCMCSFHLLLYDTHKLGLLLYTILGALLYPLCFVYQCQFIKSVEQQFGHELLRFQNNGRRQKQLQIFCHYKLVSYYTLDRSMLNIFNLNRSHILECLYVSWIFAMFTNSLLVNSPHAWVQHNANKEHGIL
ncbi:uncharacterized protein Grl36b [Drosophila montana]|uniref:uncharacterized protein Grl36b n=1 Tax=Drosophila montana TaxID=40370 RepID=UPI00313E3D69